MKPFEFTTPEGMDANEVLDLYVQVFGEQMSIPSPGHTFVHGPRGSGKSMIFRYMNPDCQIIEQKSKIHELSYFAINIPIKEGQLNKEDLSFLSNKNGEILLNEHFLVINFSIKIISTLIDIDFEENINHYKEVKNFYINVFSKFLRFANGETKKLEETDNTINLILNKILNIFHEMLSNFNSIYNRLSFMNEENFTYDGPICLFNGFLLELLKGLKNLSFMPDSPIYLLIDDADNLSLIQTKILNTWVSQRTTKYVCFKISTQLNYKTLRTINDLRIDTPHDFNEINLAELYTSQRSLFKSRIEEVVKRRLKKYTNEEISCYEFFPKYEKQEKKIQEIANKYKEEKGYDYAYRYAVPDYIKDELKGNRYAYKYAGFENLVNISSGIMRNFIDFAHKMFIIEESRIENDGNKKLKKISPTVQDKVVRTYSEDYFELGFDRLISDSMNTKEESDDYNKLKNLISAVGKSFRVILLSNMSDRRVFSFALSDEPNDELKRVLKIGVNLGYFHKSMIGNKEGTGKTDLYILNRLLSPHFGLEPSNFAGYKFVRCVDLNKALENENTNVGNQKPRSNLTFSKEQYTLFEKEK